MYYIKYIHSSEVLVIVSFFWFIFLLGLLSKIFLNRVAENLQTPKVLVYLTRQTRAPQTITLSKQWSPFSGLPATAAAAAVGAAGSW